MTNKAKIRLYEDIFHKIQLLREVSMNPDKLRELLDLIGNWSYSHRMGNGTLSERQQNKIIQKSLNRLKENVNGQQTTNTDTERIQNM